MRAISVLFALVVTLFGSASVAFAQCKEEPAPPVARKIARPVKGIAPVKIVFAADKSDAKLPEEKDGQGKAAFKTVKILNSTLQFWIEGDVRVLFDRKGYLKQVHHCQLRYEEGKPAEKRTYVKVWYLPQPGDSDVQDGGSALLLPSAVVERKPRVGVTFDSGNSLVGTWEVSKEKGMTVAVLRLAEPE